MDSHSEVGEFVHVFCHCFLSPFLLYLFESANRPVFVVLVSQALSCYLFSLLDSRGSILVVELGCFLSLLVFFECFLFSREDELRLSASDGLLSES